MILAGGRGTRFWPVSTRREPKQFLDMLGDGSMLQCAFRRIGLLCPPERTLVVTGSDYGALVSAQLPTLPRENVLLEPVPRNTAASIGWAARVVSLRGSGEETMVVIPSDHVVSPDSAFAETMRRAASAAASGWLMTIGVRPSRPATGYGYLERGEDRGGFWEVRSFREKPDLATAVAYACSGVHFWNAGIFVWKAANLLEEMHRLLPDLHGGLLHAGESCEFDPGGFASLPSVSIDYGVMEKADRVGMIEAGFAWDDVGDWPAARRSGIRRGEVLALASGDCTVWTPGMLTILLGVKDISVVSADGVILVMGDGKSQDLREVVARMEKERPDLV